MIKSFRGKLADDQIETIRLSTNDGLTGYRIVKFELMPANPGGQDSVNVVKVHSNKPSTIDANVDFSDATLLAAGVVQNTSSYAYGEYTSIIFDNTKFNQDIYISNKDYATGEAANYHLELEQVRLDLNEATVATLKDMRGRE
jgi:hypothetical protein